MIKNFFWILITIVLSPLFYIRIFINKHKNKKQNILLISTGKIGDLVCTTPVFREIKKNFPDSYLVVGIREQSHGVVQNNIHIDRFIFLNSEKYQGFWGEIKLIRELIKEKFILSINLSPRAFNTILPFWVGIPKRITSTSKFTGKMARIFSFFNSYRLEYKQHTSKLRHNLEILRFLEIKDFSEKKEVFTTSEEEKKAIKFLRENNLKEDDFLIGISVTAGNKIKEWEPDKFCQLADRLIEELKAKIIFIGTPDDEALISGMIGKMKNEVIPATSFKLNELAALFKKLKLFISVDTGPLYIAHAVGTPVVDVVGPCDINEQPPRDDLSELVYKRIDCWPCSFVIPPARYCKNKHSRCIKEITVEDVFVAIIKLLERIYV
jgi:ADP-heptose:LPS heptosyltransferase